MLKSGPISKVEGFYITHNHKNMDIKDLAQDLNRPIKIVEKWMKKNIVEAPAGIKAGEHFARNKGTVVMTENASTLSDSKRKKKTLPRQPCITKIKDE